MKAFTLVVEHFVGKCLIGAESSQEILVGQNFVGLVVLQIGLGGFTKLNEGENCESANPCKNQKPERAFESFSKKSP
jgi:hypothetical protein